MTASPTSLAWRPAVLAADERARACAATDLEREQVHRAAEGVEDAQAWLVRRVIAPVRAVARTLLRNPADADDAAQKALLEVLTSARSFRGEGSLDAWARRIAVRTALRHARTERRQPTAAAADLEGADWLPAEGDTPALDALPRPLPYYLAELPAAQRDALILHHALGYTVPEVAELTEVGVETVRGRLRLGTAALRKRVRQDLLIGANGPRRRP